MATTLAAWVHGARVRTLPAAISPVLIGTGAAAWSGAASVPRALLATGVALALQIGVNFSNDYSDGVRGTDDQRVGPMRLTATGAVRPATVKRAAFASFAVAAVLGLVLCALAGAWWLIGVGAVAVLAAWYYTGGSSPYGYAGLGEVAVLVFFGLVATLGTTYTQAGAINAPAVLGAFAVGLLSCAILMVNNIRDIGTDAPAGKRTLAVRLGQVWARRAYAAMMALGVLSGVAVAFWEPWALLVAVLAGPAVVLSRRVVRGAHTGALILTLRDSGFVVLGMGLLLGGVLTLA